jgi:phosphatidylserine/phosphatidylglycerophosphate/cardiolipin synthase-like enzyme
MPTLEQLETKYFPSPFSGVPHSNDTVVIPHVDGVLYFGAIADALDQCTGPGDRIYIASWCFQPDFPLRLVVGSPTLSNLLLEKAADGADVRIIIASPRFSIGREGRRPDEVEYWKGLLAELGHLSEIVSQNIRAARSLRSAKIGGKTPLSDRVLLDWGGYDDSRHEKSTIIYSASSNELHAFVGGIDFRSDRMVDEAHVTSYLPNKTYWHDAGVQLRGGAAAAVLGNFRTRWDETVTLPGERFLLDGVKESFMPTTVMTPPTQPPSPTQPPPSVVPAGEYIGTSVRILRSYDKIRVHSPWLSEKNEKNLPWKTLPPEGIREILAVLQKAISAATNYIYVEDQTINPGFLATIYSKLDLLFPSISAACGRGVKVIFVTQGYAGPDSPVSANLTMSMLIQSVILDPLSASKRENFALYYVTDTKVHSKIVLIDDEFASIGSANLWDRSMTGTESELNAAIVHPGGEDSLVADLRVRLWRGHMRVDSNPSVDTQLRELGKSLGFFRTSWGTGITFPHPNNAFVEIVAPPEPVPP